MKEATIIGNFQQLYQMLARLEQSLRLGVTGESIRNQALQNALTKKGIITDADITTEIGLVIAEAQKQEAEAAKAKEEENAKPTLVTPTPQEVQAVEKGTLETPPTPPTA